MKALGSIVLAAVLSLGAAPAYAGHGYYDDGRCEGGYCAGEDERGDCRDSGSNCSDNDFSPEFRDSPVRDAFNFSPVVCLPGSTCNFDGRRGDQQQP